MNSNTLINDHAHFFNHIVVDLQPIDVVIDSENQLHKIKADLHKCTSETRIWDLYLTKLYESELDHKTTAYGGVSVRYY